MLQEWEKNAPKQEKWLEFKIHRKGGSSAFLLDWWTSVNLHINTHFWQCQYLDYDWMDCHENLCWRWWRLELERLCCGAIWVKRRRNYIRGCVTATQWAHGLLVLSLSLIISKLIIFHQIRHLVGDLSRTTRALSHSPLLECRISSRLKRILAAAAIFMDSIHWDKTWNTQEEEWFGKATNQPAMNELKTWFWHGFKSNLQQFLTNL